MKLDPERPREGGPSNESNAYVAARATLGTALLAITVGVTELAGLEGTAVAPVLLVGLIAGLHQFAAWVPEASHRAVDHVRTRRYEA